MYSFIVRWTTLKIQENASPQEITLTSSSPKNSVVIVLSVIFIFLAGLGFVYYQGRTAIPERINVLSPSNETRLTTVSRGDFSAFVAAVGEVQLDVMDFSQPMPLDPPPQGWWHRKFLTRAPMDMSFQRMEGEHGLRLATDNSASMLFRFVEVDLGRYPLLAWRWLIENPIDTDEDELTRAGDDHPARLFVGFSNAENDRRALEIIWGNELSAGDYKYIGTFPHYVANGGNANVGQWYDEEINLLDIYQELWPDDVDPRITDIGLFCDSDETNDDSVAWFSYVRLLQQFDLPERL